MPVIDLILAIIVCICIGIIYTIFGYNVIELFTDGPNWKLWEQCLFWMFWPILIPLFIGVVILLPIFIALVTCYDLIKSAIKKLSR